MTWGGSPLGDHKAVRYAEHERDRAEEPESPVITFQLIGASVPP